MGHVKIIIVNEDQTSTSQKLIAVSIITQQQCKQFLKITDLKGFWQNEMPETHTITLFKALGIPNK